MPRASKRPNPGETKPRTVFISDDAWKQLRLRALQQGRNASELVRDFIDEGLRKANQ